MYNCISHTINKVVSQSKGIQASDTFVSATLSDVIFVATNDIKFWEILLTLFKLPYSIYFEFTLPLSNLNLILSFRWWFTPNHNICSSHSWVWFEQDYAVTLLIWMDLTYDILWKITQLAFFNWKRNGGVFNI